MDSDTTFFDPVRGDQFDPSDEVPWSVDLSEADDDDRRRFDARGGTEETN